MLPSPPPNNPDDAPGLIESVRSIWFNSHRVTEILPAEKETSDATLTTLDSFPLEDDTTYHIQTVIVGFKSSFNLMATVYRDGGIAVIQGQTSIHSAGSYTAVFDVDKNDIRIRVSGSGRWVSETMITQV